MTIIIIHVIVHQLSIQIFAHLEAKLLSLPYAFAHYLQHLPTLVFHFMTVLHKDDSFWTGTARHQALSKHARLNPQQRVEAKILCHFHSSASHSVSSYAFI